MAVSQDKVFSAKIESRDSRPSSRPKEQEAREFRDPRSSSLELSDVLGYDEGHTLGFTLLLCLCSH